MTQPLSRVSAIATLRTPQRIAYIALVTLRDARRCRTASANTSSTGSVCVQLRHASVIDTPYFSGTPGFRSCAGLEMALDHHADDPLLALRQRREILRDLDLPLVRLVPSSRASNRPSPARATRPCAAPRSSPRHARRRSSGRSCRRGITCVIVAARLEDRGHPHLRHPHERMARSCCDDRVGRDLHAAVGAVLEADRAAQARSELAMALARSCARRSRPTRSGRAMYCGQQVEEFGRRRQAQRVDVEQLAARRAALR